MHMHHRQGRAVWIEAAAGAATLPGYVVEEKGRGFAMHPAPDIGGRVVVGSRWQIVLYVAVLSLSS